MFVYGKMAANAIAVMSYLATSSGKKAGSGEIAQVRKLSPTLAAKLLTQLGSCWSESRMHREVSRVRAPQ